MRKLGLLMVGGRRDRTMLSRTAIARRALVIACLFIPKAACLCNAGQPNPPADLAAVQRMIALLEAGGTGPIADDQIAEAEKAMFALPRLVPSSVPAQKATVRYVERLDSSGHGFLVCYARSMAGYDAHFACEVMTSLAKRQDQNISEVWLPTLAMMGPKAAGQAKQLAKYLHEEPDPATRMQARIALAMIGAAPPDTKQLIEGEIRNRTQAGRAAVWTASLVGFRGWASEKAVSEVKKWLTDDASGDDRCFAAVALAISGCRDPLVERSLRGLLDKAVQEPDSSARIWYAYALAILDAHHAEQNWRIILKKLAPEHFNHTDNSGLIEISQSLPDEHGQIIRKLRQDADPEVAAGAARAWEFLGLLVSDPPVKSGK